MAPTWAGVSGPSGVVRAVRARTQGGDGKAGDAEVAEANAALALALAQDAAQPLEVEALERADAPVVLGRELVDARAVAEHDVERLRRVEVSRRQRTWARTNSRSAPAGSGAVTSARTASSISSRRCSILA